MRKKRSKRHSYFKILYNKKAPPRIKAEFWLFLIILFALALRLYFFVGIVYVDEQDEGIYLTKAINTFEGNSDLSRYRNLGDRLPNPADAFDFRKMVYYPPSLMFSFFGISEFSAIAFSLIYSLCSIIVIFLLGKNFFNEKVGLISAFLLSFFPLDILLSTRLMGDIIVAFSIWGGILLFFFLAEKRNSKTLYLLSGVTFGLGYLAKISVFLVIILFSVYFLYTRKVRHLHLLVLAGFLIVLFFEGMFYYTETGDFFLNYHISTGVYDYKLENENTESISIIPNMFKIFYLDAAKQVYYIPVIFGMERINILPINGFDYFGLFFYAALFSAAFLLYKKEKRSYLLTLFVVSILLYLEFFPTFFRFFIDDILINFIFLKKARLLILLVIPSVILISASLEKMKYKVSAIIILILIISSLIAVNTSREFYVSGVSSLREAAEFLKTQEKKPVYSDHLAITTLRMNLGDNWQIKSFPQTLPENAYMIDYGSRGMDISPDYIESLRPDYLYQPNEFRILGIIDNPAKKFGGNHKDLIIYSIG